MRISDWSSDVCSSDLQDRQHQPRRDQAPPIAREVAEPSKGNPGKAGRHRAAKGDIAEIFDVARPDQRAHPPRQHDRQQRNLRPRAPRPAHPPNPPPPPPPTRPPPPPPPPPHPPVPPAPPPPSPPTPPPPTPPPPPPPPPHPP